ncbi:MAG: sugar transferase [Cyanobacteria bacterium J06621_8]
MLSILLGWLVGNNVYILLFSSGNADHGLNLLFPSLLGVSLSLLIACQGYARGIRSRKYTSVFKAITLSYLALSPICAELFSENPILLLFTAWLATIITINGFRWLIFRVLLYLRQQFSPLKIKVMLIGEQEDVRKCLYLLEKSQEFKINSQLNLSQFADTEEAAAQFEQIDLQKVDEILICSWEKIKDSRKFLWKLRCSGTYWRILQLEEQVELDNLEISHFEGVTALRFIESSIRGIDFLTKRIADIAISFVLLVIFGLPMLIIAFLIRIDSPGDIFYRQTRVGLSGNHFKVWKFRTMVQNASQLQQQLEAKNEVDGGVLFKIKDDPRITKIGRILRKYSLDELPQIFNVLRGEMSLVGPRPLPIRDVAKFAPEHFFRHEVLPGITGLWQVSGRSDTDSQNLFSLDLEYIENWSLSLDFKILLRTVEVVLKSKGAY